MLDLSQFTAVLFDMDGTLFRGGTALPGARELLAFCAERGIACACVTNNSTMTPAQYEAKLAGMGIPVSAAQIVTSSVAARRYLEQEAPRGTPIYAVGMDGLRQELFGDGYYVLEEHNPRYVVVGGDFDVTYAKLRTACLAIRAGARFIGTNPDTTYPTEQGLVPGAGSLLALLRAATDVEPFVIGKPAPTMLLAAAALLGAEPARTLVVGDRLDTDIAGARAALMSSVLVMTGVETAEGIASNAVRADLVLPGLPELLERWQS
ncbi:MAG TPA: HAD-IIA family hydrolase [Roseiflexaceae bacterium]|nr:HAD-IIA family hydrolase [Roseiflexaceae bacterium]